MGRAPRMGLRAKLIGMAIMPAFVLVALFVLVYDRNSRRLMTERDAAAHMAGVIALNSTMEDMREQLVKQALKLLNVDQFVVFLQDQRNSRAKMVLDGLFLSLKEEQVTRYCLYDAQLRPVLQHADAVPPWTRPPGEAVGAVFARAAADFLPHVYFRGAEGGSGGLPAEFSVVVAISNDDDAIVGYLELAKKSLVWMQAVGELTRTTVLMQQQEGGKAALATDPQVEAQLALEQAGNLDPGSQHVRRVDGRAWAVDVLPLNGSDQHPLAKLLLVKEVTAAEQAASRTQRWATGICLFALAVTVGVGLLQARSITAPMEEAMAMLTELEHGRLSRRLNMHRSDEIGQMAATMDQFAAHLQTQVVSGLEKLSQGDLSFAVSPYDEQDVVGNALATTVQDLAAIIAEIGETTDQIAVGAGEVSSASQSLSQGAIDQAGSIDRLSGAMGQVSGQTKINAENAGEACRLAALVKQDAELGHQQMQGMQQAMYDITDAGKNISKIIKVIDEIAFQTNLLALNAAVEAARAGQYGKGFAVVAEEVRNLAVRSAKAAHETSALIAGSAEKSEHGRKMADMTSSSLGKIVTGINHVHDLISGISAASREQAQSIARMNDELLQVDQVIQANTAAAEEGAAAAVELSSRSDRMRQMVGRFRIAEEDSGAVS